MKRRTLVLLALVMTVVAAFFATAARATTTVTYLNEADMRWAAGSATRSAFTGLAWQQNQAGWTTLNGGSPSVCLTYVDVADQFYLTATCHPGAGTFTDFRNEANYSAAWCQANPSNGFLTEIENCNGIHN